METQILIVHPKDKTTNFLNRLRKYLEREFVGNVSYYSIKPREESHQLCLQRIRDHSQAGLIIFMGHGIDGVLFGSKGRDHEAFVSDEARQENPELYYQNNNFINSMNIGVFSKKKIFCLACNSNNHLALSATQHGAKVFVGFGEIPTCRKEFSKKIYNLSNRDIYQVRNEIVAIVGKSIVCSVKHNYSFDQLVSVLKFITSQRMAKHLQSRDEKLHRHIIADYLYKFKQGIKVLGESSDTILCL